MDCGALTHRMACDGVHGQQRHGIYGVRPQRVAGPRTLQDARLRAHEPLHHKWR